ncbi:hypothetical protein [Bifidobacterium pullorum]|uniref:hypothetical protein n=1 Tax=Bifidobacterium pullorum TaxID=78448 RepID=UPI001D0BF1E6|nr:hypothetical protein [Bifidobacterium pullorum]
MRIESRGKTLLEALITGDWLKVAPDDWLKNDIPFILTVERDTEGADSDVSCAIIFSGVTIDEQQSTDSDTAVTCRYNTWRNAIR